MSKAIATLACHSAILLTFLLVVSSAGAQEVGAVTRVQGSALAERGAEIIELSAEAPVIRDDLLVTGESSRLEVLLQGDTTLTLGENGALVLDDLIVTPTESSLRVRVTGAFRLASGLLPHSARTEIITPLATIGIRGTDVWGGPIDGAFGVFLIDGVVEITTQAGSVILDTPGTGTTVRAADTAPSDPVTWPEQKVDRAVAAISFGTP
jgi:hypothetical protein